MKVYKMDNSNSMKAFVLPLGFSSDRQIEATSDKPPLIRVNPNPNMPPRPEKQKKINASSPSGMSQQHVVLNLDAIIENPKESLPNYPAGMN